MENPSRLTDPSVGDWVSDRLLEHRHHHAAVGRAVPTGFPRVVRVLHPAGDGRTWAEVAAANDRTLHALAQWCGVEPAYDHSDRPDDPAEGSVPAETLGAILEHCPASDDVIYGVWEGFGAGWDHIDDQSKMPDGLGRGYVLFRASKGAHVQWPGTDPRWPQSANLIWPPDRSWCIATEIDWDSTLIACSDEAADGILDDARLEAFAVGYDDRLSFDGDAVNPAPTWAT